MLDLLISGVVIVVGGGIIGGLTNYVIQRRQDRHLAARDQLECGLKVVQGQVHGMKSGRMEHGKATIGPGTITFHRGLPGGRGRRPGAPDVHLREVTVGPSRRQAKGRELLSATGTVLDLRSPGVTLQWIVQPSQVDWALAKVTGLRTDTGDIGAL